MNKDRGTDNSDVNNDDTTGSLPKKPLTAYIIYFQEKKPLFVEKHKSKLVITVDLNLSELTKLIAKEWKEISQAEKKPYLDKAADDRKRFENEMNEFRKKHGASMNLQPEDNIEEEIASESGEIDASENSAKERSIEAVEVDE